GGGSGRRDGGREGERRDRFRGRGADHDRPYLRRRARRVGRGQPHVVRPRSGEDVRRVLEGGGVAVVEIPRPVRRPVERVVGERDYLAGLRQDWLVGEVGDGRRAVLGHCGREDLHGRRKRIVRVQRVVVVETDGRPETDKVDRVHVRRIEASP